MKSNIIHTSLDTANNQSAHILRAKYVLQSPVESIENGVIVVTGQKITEVGRWDAIAKEAKGVIQDFENCAIIPGFINAHTHLELTDLQGRIPPQKKFTDWISNLVKARLLWTKRKFHTSVNNGIMQSLASGTTTVCDITNSAQAFHALANAQLRSVVFQELIGTDPSKAAKIAERAERDLSKLQTRPLMRTGVSPHAPYTVSDALYKECQKISESLNCPICTHLSETLSEIDFLQSGEGEFVEILRRFRMLPKNWMPPRMSPVAYLASLCKLSKNWLLAHCNYLSDEDMKIIKNSGSSVVFCPRSHAYFGHKEHPFLRLLDMGINVALGTDSLASNESLSILDEMKFLARNEKDVSPKLIFKMATENGARSIGMENTIGSLHAGKEADITVIRLAETAEGTPYERLLDDAAISIFTMVAGQTVWNDSSDN